MKILYGATIRDTAIRNLMLAQERISEEGNAAEIISITKFMLKISKKFDNQMLEMRFGNNEKV